MPEKYRHLNIECKVRKRMAIVGLFESIRDEHPDKIPLVFVREVRKRKEESLVVMDIATFRRFWEAAKDSFSLNEKEELTPDDDPLGLLNEEEPPTNPKPRKSVLGKRKKKPR